MSTLVLWNRRPATPREKHNALLPSKTRVDALTGRDKRAFALVTWNDTVVWTAEGVNEADVEHLLVQTPLEPSTNFPELPRRTKNDPYKLRKDGRFLFIFPAFSIKKRP